MNASSQDSILTEHLFISHRALQRAQELLKQSDKPNIKLRIFVVGGGCGGLQYGFQLDEQTNLDDVIIEREGASFVIDPISFCYLSQASIDYQDEPKEMARFVVSNPHIRTSCGCHHGFENEKI